MKKTYETSSKEIINTSDTNNQNNKNVQKSNGIKLKVNFENLNLSDNEDDNNIERSPLKKTESNLNREAKLQWQQSLLNKKREANNHSDVQINIGGNIPRGDRNGRKNIYSLNTNNKPINSNNFRANPTASHFLTHEIEEDQEQISNLNKNICKVRTAPNYVSKEIITNFNKNIPSTRPTKQADDQRNEIMVKSIKILAVTQDHSKDYSSESEDNVSLDSDQLKTKTSGGHRSQVANRHQEMFRHHDSIDNDKNTSMMVAPLPNNHEEFNYESGDHSVIEIKTEIESETEIEKESEDSIDLSIFELLDKNSKKFILKPATMGLTLKCQIFRHKGIYSQYKFYLENLEGQLLLIMTARKRKKTKTTCYIINYISYDETNVEKYIETPIAKLKSNLMGTQFTLYDFGIKPSNSSSHHPNSNNIHRSSTSSNNEQKAHSSGASDTQCDEEATLQYDSDLKYLRKEYLSITYDFNIFGYKGPRQMSIIIPGMDNHFNREDFFIRRESDSIINAWRKLENAVQIKDKPKVKAGRFGMKSRGSLKRNNKEKNNKNDEIKDEEEEDNSDEDEKRSSKFDDSQVNVVRLVNKTPGWHPQYRSFALNFNGRVTQPSVKNYQIVHEVNTDYIVTQFGKVNVDMYTCDYSYPLCSLQAFGIAISSLDNKFGCD